MLRIVPMRVQEVENWAEYSLDCPEGSWTARLDNKAWARQSIVLYFSECGTERRFRFSIFFSRSYKADDGSGPSFKDDAQPGEHFALTTGKTKTGHSKLLSAQKY
jgi:hypothetical protein